jgi:hypothetical protein
LPEDPLLARLLKKVQLQGGVTHPYGWVPAEKRGVLGSYAAASRERANPPAADRWAFFSSLLWLPAVGEGGSRVDDAVGRRKCFL